MENFIIVTRILTAIGAPIAAIVLSTLAILRARGTQGQQPKPDTHCLQCKKSTPGGQGEFAYSENLGSPRRQAFRNQLETGAKVILGSESHFICDSCASKYLLHQVLQVVVMIVPYPLYLYVILPLLGGTAFLANFLIETVLVIFVLAGATAAYDLFRTAREGKTPLAEMRDRLAIKLRKNTLGKKHQYHTRLGGIPGKNKPG